MSKRAEGSKRYDLEERTLQFAKDIRIFVKTLPRTIANEQDIRQLVIGLGGCELHRSKRVPGAILRKSE